ncbi:MAG: CPBP family intramembrane metalloprotease [Planctomycetota bacterium]|nr:MAG: CPBP family intramembrane metalloprotease [Planctomycetota bacterium]
MKIETLPIRLWQPPRHPAFLFFLLLPLALLHGLGRDPDSDLAAAWLAQGLFRPLGNWAFPLLAMVLLLAGVMSWRHLRRHRESWGKPALYTVLEGCFWGWLLGPFLAWLTAWLPLERAPLALWSLDRTLHHWAAAAGAGLYEELIFRGFMLGAGTLLLKRLFHSFGWGEGAASLAFGLALILSAAAFAFAHAFGDPRALEAQVFAFRALAGVFLGFLFAWRGLAVVAYTHASYDLFLLS